LFTSMKLTEKTQIHPAAWSKTGFNLTSANPSVHG
jgi:hypothetical protein